MSTETGMSLTTGKLISDGHLQQSIADIILTPIGSRVMRRTYGCALFELIDSCGNAVGKLRAISAIADALMKWEPRIDLEQITLEYDDAQHIITVTGMTASGALCEQVTL